MPQHKDPLHLWREILVLKVLNESVPRIAELLSISETEVERIALWSVEDALRQAASEAPLLLRYLS